MSDAPPVSEWLVAFALTLAFELPVYVLMLRRWFHAWWTPCLLTLGVDLVTHPALWYVVPTCDALDWGYERWFYTVEAGVVLVEGVLIALALGRRHPWRTAVGRGLLASLVANSVSAGAGRLLDWLG